MVQGVQFSVSFYARIIPPRSQGGLRICTHAHNVKVHYLIRKHAALQIFEVLT